MEEETKRQDEADAVAFAELLTEGLIVFNPEHETELRLTDAGIDYAWDLYHTHTHKEMLALALMWETIREGIVEEEED